jgi:hypothetical protein
MINIDINKIIDRIPRKLTAVIVCIWLILDWALKQPEVNQICVMIIVAIIVVAGITSHTLLEWRNPTPTTDIEKQEQK